MLLEFHYSGVNPDTGEVLEVVPEFKYVPPSGYW